MMRSFRLALLAGALSILVSAPALALDTSGVWVDDIIEGQQANIWKDMDSEAIMSVIDTMPDKTGSRALVQLAKAVLLAPVKITGEAAAEGEAKSEADILSEKITAARIAKLLAMGGINEAKTLVNEVDTGASLEPELMEQVALTLVASSTKQAACIDLLAYKSETPDKFAALSDGPKAIVKDCLPEKTEKSAAKNELALADLKALTPWDTALKLSGDGASISTSVNVAAEYTALSPFQQAMVIRSPALSARLQWQLLPLALRHDYVSVKQGQDIYKEVTLPKEKPTALETRMAATGKPVFERLAMYYKTISSDKANSAQLMKDLSVSVVAAGAISDFYALLPFSPAFESALDVHAMRPRSAFIVGLVQSMNGASVASTTGAIVPDDSVWILSVLNGDQPFTTEGFTGWSDKNSAMLAVIAPDLEYRLAQALQDMVKGDENKSTYLSNYVNKKSLTRSGNYVMHNELLLSKAESLGSDSSIGSVLILLAQASNKTSPDRVDPAGVVKMVRMLNDMGLTHTARKLSAESLVFKMKPVSPMGNNKVIGEK